MSVRGGKPWGRFRWGTALGQVWVLGNSLEAVDEKERGQVEAGTSPGRGSRPVLCAPAHPHPSGRLPVWVTWPACQDLGS